MTGNDFRAARKAAHMTLEEVAKAMGLKTYQSVQRYDSAGEKEISIKPKYWPVLAQLFGIPVEAFIPPKPLAALTKSMSGQVQTLSDKASKDVVQSVGLEHLTAEEAYGISLKREYDPKGILWGRYVAKLIEIQNIMK